MSTRARSAPSPRRANAFAVQITAGVAGGGERRRDGAMANAMSAATIATMVRCSRGRRLRLRRERPGTRRRGTAHRRRRVEKEEHLRELSDQLQRERRKLRKMLGRSQR
jgi:hypothetical protein